MNRVWAWVWHLVRSKWVPLLLVGGLLVAASVSLDLAGWVNNNEPIVQSLSLGFLFGWLLAISRFRGWFVTLYGLLLAPVVGVQAAGGILPALEDVISTPFFELVDRMNLRLVTFWLRFEGWVSTFRSGGEVDDTGPFVLLAAVVLWGAGIWLMWNLIRKHNALLGLLPLTVIMAFNVQLSRQSLSTYWSFLLFAILLVAYAGFKRQVGDWEARRIDFSDQLGIDWSVGTVAVAVIVLLLARVSPLLITPDGWRVLSEFVESTREQTSETAGRLFTGVNTPPPPVEEGDPKVYVNTPNMRELGGSIPTGSQVVMWVTTSDPPPFLEEYDLPVPDLEQKGHYWRNAIFGSYTGRGWDPAPLSPEPVAPQPPGEDSPVGRYYLRQDYEIRAIHSGALFSVSEPVQVGEDLTLRSTTPDGSLLVEGMDEVYSVISAATRATGNQLAASPVDYPDEIRAAYLALPESLPERVRSLARRVAGSGNSPFHKALRIQQYLRENYTYDLEVRDAPRVRDVVDYFLFDAPRGFCSHYASAMVVMLRAVDVPARIVTGYATGEYDTSRNAYRVPVSATHAWVEVFFPGIGWVEFEPTANRTPFEYTEINASPAVDLPPPALDTDGSASQPLVLILVAAIALGLLILPLWLMRTFSSARTQPDLQASRLYLQIRRALASAGLPEVPSQTPAEYLASYRAKLAPYQHLERALRQSTDLYQQASYSPRSPDAGRVRAAVDQWRNSVVDWLKLWLSSRWRSR